MEDKPFWSNLWGVVQHGGTNDPNIQREGEFHKRDFPVI